MIVQQLQEKHQKEKRQKAGRVAEERTGARGRSGEHRQAGALSGRAALLPSEAAGEQAPTEADATTPQLEPNSRFEDWDGLPVGFDWRSLLVRSI